MLMSWADTARRLVDVAMGRKPADLVIRNGRWVNVHSGEIIAGTDVATSPFFILSVMTGLMGGQSILMGLIAELLVVPHPDDLAVVLVQRVERLTEA